MNLGMEISIVIATVAVICLVLSLAQGGRVSRELRNTRRNLEFYMTSSEERFRTFGEDSSRGQEAVRETLDRQLSQMRESTERQLQTMRDSTERQLQQMRESTDHQLQLMRESTENRLMSMQKDNGEKLEEMRAVVDEKLQKTITARMNESFKLVSDRLEQVYKGLGEMQSLASDVGDLSRVLSNVKTRGILGEVQLEAILSEILAPEQYDKNVATRKGSRNVVEFAIRIPSADGFIYLPVDSKFPGDTYGALRLAAEEGDRALVEEAQKRLIATIKSEARDIRDKYLDPPHTTDFAIMFLPFEGLYAEVVNAGLIEVLQRDYHVNVAGPSTMAALLNSLQMGFRAFAIQKRSSEVWAVLGAVKTEFEKFDGVLRSAQQRITQVNDELDKLVGVRTRQIQRKLRDVEALDDLTIRSLLDDEE